VGHIDGPIVAYHLTEIGQCPTVVQVEVAGEDVAPVRLGPLSPSHSTPALGSQATPLIN
jgi:hypothetical protein